MYRSVVRHFLQMNAILHLGQMLEFGALNSPGIISQEVQNAYLLP